MMIVMNIKIKIFNLLILIIVILQINALRVFWYFRELLFNVQGRREKNLVGS